MKRTLDGDFNWFSGYLDLYPQTTIPYSKNLPTTIFGVFLIIMNKILIHKESF